MVTRVPVPDAARAAMRGTWDESLPAAREGAGLYKMQ